MGGDRDESEFKGDYLPDHGHPDFCSIAGSGDDQFSIAQKMSWAFKRKTTRVEDMAYSLIGIFGVNIPLLYGEGEKAFNRLRLEILSSSQDTATFAWTARGTSDSAFEGRRSCKADRGLLAHSPVEFSECRDIIWVGGESSGGKLASMTAMGLRLEMCLVEEKSTGTSVGERKVPDAGLRLAVTPERLSENRYCRVDYETVRTVQLDCIADSAESLTKPDYKRIVLADGSTMPIEKRIIFVREASS